MSRGFVSDPRSVVKSGDVVRVKVLSVDVPRHRISLTLRLDDEDPRPAGRRARTQDRSARNQKQGDRTARGDTALADALRRAGLDTGSIG
jgi:protein Tex